MPDRNKKFHEFALKSILFKGRNDWYFCYLKSERIAHVLTILSDRGSSAALKDIADDAASVPAEIARVAAGELDIAQVLADVFALLSLIRLAATRMLLTQENGTILVREYEQVAERLVAGSHPSPYASAQDFFVPEFGESPLPLVRGFTPAPTLKDQASPYNKGHSKGQTERMSLILACIRKQKSPSIKDIAAVVRDCSEKTIQRELNDLIKQGLVRRVGERRWSQYQLVERE
jgi:hypothetical protein